MVDFKSLLAASKAKQMEQMNGTDSIASENAQDSVGSGNQESAEAGQPSTETVEAPRKAMSFGRPQAQAESAPATVEQSVATASGTPKLAGLKLGNFGGNKPNPDRGAAPSVIDEPAGLTSLEALSNTALGEATSVSGHADETPATAPIRELPEGLDKQQLGFVGLLDQVYTIMHDPELIGNVAKSIMVELKTRPEMKSLLGPDDARQLIRAARESMGLARIKKTETKQKRAGGTGRSSKAIDADIAGDLDSMLAGMGTG